MALLTRAAYGFVEVRKEPLDRVKPGKPFPGAESGLCLDLEIDRMWYGERASKRRGLSLICGSSHAGSINQFRKCLLCVCQALGINAQRMN